MSAAAMDAPIKRPNILHLGGITLNDFVPIEDVFDEKILEVVEKSDQGSGTLPFEKIPAVFTSVEEWPFSTNLRCWSCTFTFDGPPCFVPTFVRTGSDSVEVGVEGNFCTFNCAARYIDDTYPPRAYAVKHWSMRDNLCLVYFYFKGLRVKHIKPAPRKTELIGFGGDLDEEDFWARLRELDPLNGLRDHRPGTVVPERMRPFGVSVWDVCTGVAAKTALAERSAADFPPLILSATTTEMIARVGTGARRNNPESPRLSSEEMARKLETHLAEEASAAEPAVPELAPAAPEPAPAAPESEKTKI
ncbi:MAG: hypothetical protein VW891_18155, partial [Novosphingobium sp.]